MVLILNVGSRKKSNPANKKANKKDDSLEQLAHAKSVIYSLEKKVEDMNVSNRLYGDLVYKFEKIVGRVDFSDQFRKIIVRYKRIGYNINIMRQSACLVFNPITVNNFASLFNCTPVGRASDSMMALT